MTPEEIHTLIGKDLSQKIKENKKTKYYFHSNLNICSEPTLTAILNGKGGNSLNLSVIFQLYKAMGYAEINIKDGEKTLIIKPV